MKENKLRSLLNSGKPTVTTRFYSAWPHIVEAIGATGQYDYAEYVAEYAPTGQFEMENICRAAELHDLSSMIKVDYQNRFYVAQKALGAGFQSVLFTDHKTADEVRETISWMRPDTADGNGHFGCIHRRWIGFQVDRSQMEYAKMLGEVVLAFMIEKREAMENIEEICAVPGVDMLQFGPSDFSMNHSKNLSDNRAECLKQERKMIEVALKHGVHPRCEINSVEEAKYYSDLGVRHFSIGDELRILRSYWNGEGKKMRDAADAL